LSSDDNTFALDIEEERFLSGLQSMFIDGYYREDNVVFEGKPPEQFRETVTLGQRVRDIFQDEEDIHVRALLKITPSV
jgi:hypothetical protein